VIRSLGALAIGAVLSVTGRAYADEQSSAAAQLAYDEALALEERGDHVAACAKLEDSLELEEALGARFALAECYERIGRLASAWHGYVRVADQAAREGEGDKEAYARKRAAALRPRVPTITVTIPDAARRLPELTLRYDGEAIASSHIGTAMPVDPGTHRYTLGAVGYEFVTREISITNESGGNTLALPMLVRSQPVPSPRVTPSPPRTPPRATKPAAVPPLAIAGLVVGSAGLVTIGVSLGIAAVASNDYHDAAGAHCSDGFCTEEGLALTEDARSRGTAASALFGVGAGVAALGLGLTIAGFSMGGDEGSQITLAPRLGPRHATLSLSGRF
jgi:hypothetical protein